jgi:DNA polymerase-3 subunit epsilon
MTGLFFDTETTGLPLFKERSTDERQPHLVQIALILAKQDGSELAAECHLVRPDGWVIPPELTAIHGISHERAMDEGIPERVVVDMFIAMQAKATIRVAHNAAFDDRIMRIATTRAGVERDFIELIEARQQYCTCNASKKLVNLPPTPKMLAAGFRGPKSPSLAETIKYFFGEDLSDAHTALADARGCARAYFHILKGGAAFVATAEGAAA